MVRAKDLAIAVVVVGLAAAAVVAQLGSGPEPTDPAATLRAIEVGEALVPDVTVRDLEGRPTRVGDLYGTRATVLYAWSTTCPCIPICEPMIAATRRRFGPDQGVRWIGVAGEPTDGAGGLRALMQEVEADYPMLLDPYHRLSARLGFDRAAVIAVLDADGHLRFRGNVSDDLTKPTRNHLLEVLPAIVAGETPPFDATELAYGCEYSDPRPCPADERLGPPSSAP